MLYVKTGDFSRLLTDTPIAKGAVVLNLDGVLKNKQDRFSIELTPTKHLHPKEDTLESRLATKWAYLNHSCDPNTRINVSSLQLLAIKNIEANEELLFDYETTESLMAEPFQCSCGSENCRGEIKGKDLK